MGPSGYGLGTAHWFTGGPGVDPHYNGTTAEAAAWGAHQAPEALADVSANLATTEAAAPLLYPALEGLACRPVAGH
ncbi:MAG: hypothetical protein ACRDPD_05135 [Streptosporangiaceae bacterium]